MSSIDPENKKALYWKLSTKAFNIRPRNIKTSMYLPSKKYIPVFRLAPQVGLEPTTLRLTAECSAIELLRNICFLRTGLLYCAFTLLSTPKWLFFKISPSNKLEIENFTGYSPDAVLQDFYVTLFLANLAGALQYDLREEIEAAHSKPENKYTYKMNVSMTISELKRTVVEMLAATSLIRRERLFRQMTKRLMKAVVPIRPNRSFPRERRHKSARFSQNRKHL